MLPTKHIASGLVFVALLLAVSIGQPGLSAQIHSPTETWNLEGKVYAGEVGDETTPLPNVTVALYGANDTYPVVGTFLRSATTNADGWYNLPVYDDDAGLYSFIYILQTDLEGYHSIGAASAGGTVRTQNWIEYGLPIVDQVLTENLFWDRPQQRPYDLPLADLPMESRRLGAQLLENVRGKGMAPGWEDARIGPIARPLYRPDIDEIAYYEFEVLVDATPAGFIIISTGEHDFPIAHWSFEGSSMTRSLELLAEQDGKQPAKFFKLDTLSYAAETAGGDMAAVFPYLPNKVSGMDMAWLDQPAQITEETWTPDHSGEDDSIVPTSGTHRLSGPTESPLVLGGWESWQQLKDGYTQSYGVLIEDLRRDARQDWEVERKVAEFGEGLRFGVTYSLAQLCDQPTITLTGPGTAFLTTQLQERPGMTPVYVIQVDKPFEGQEVPFEVQITCPHQPAETFKFWVLTAPVRLFLPFVRNAQSAPNVVLPEPGAALSEPLSSQGNNYAIFWVHANTIDQRLYGQTTFYPPPTISSCLNGCGSTAWAMLLGWADFMANTWEWKYWEKNWGIYRPNGGYTGDIRAPKYMDAGVMNMTWEIREAVDTFCIFGSAPTYPSDMDEVSDYLSGRSNVRVSTHYNVFGYRETRLRVYARDSIIYRTTPAIIGTGWLSHYPLAAGYQWWSRDVKNCFLWWCWWETEYNRQFWVNQGWYGAGNGWITAGTWFAGEIYPSGH